MRTLAVLADPTRQRIVELLADGPLCVGEIASRFELSAPAVSQHLKALREAGLVQAHIDAQRRIYVLDAAGVETLVAWVARLKTFWAGPLDVPEAPLASARP